jgi:hypothetical protein
MYNANRLTNDTILIIRMILKHVMSSAAEAAIGSVFINAKETTVLRATLEEMGHPQPPTPLQTDNTPSSGYMLQATGYRLQATVTAL